MNRKYYARWRNTLDGWRPFYYMFDSVSEREEWIAMCTENQENNIETEPCYAREACNHSPVPTHWVNSGQLGNLSTFMGGWKYEVPSNETHIKR